jgi:protein phosphatase
MICAVGRTDVGRVRTRNEDAYLVAALSDGAAVTKGATDELCVEGGPALLIVADGVGGAVSGEIASLMATDTMLIDLRRQFSNGAFRHFEAVRYAIEDAVAAANYVIFTYALSHPQHRGMATTATLAMWHDKKLLIAQVGDSRAYLVRDGVARQITKDQSLVQRLLDAGEITADQAATSERRNIILQALGSEAMVVPDLYHEVPQHGDILVLCTDGLSNLVNADEIAISLSRERELGVACDQLIALADARGGYDNVTIVAARFVLEQPVISDPTAASDVATEASTATAPSATPASASRGLAARVRQWLR